MDAYGALDQRICVLAPGGSVPCRGSVIEGGSFCARHWSLFLFWMEFLDGARVYTAKHDVEWKRQRFRKWLNRLTPAQFERIESRCACPPLVVGSYDSA